MRSAIGNSLLLYLVIIIVSAIVLIFVGILSYSKAYRVKNRIIEIIEKNENYDTFVEDEISAYLRQAGYQLGNCERSDANIENKTSYKYCVSAIYENPNNQTGKRRYEVTTYVEFYFPIINDLLKVPVKGETKTLGVSY